MPRVARFTIPAIGELFRQLRYAPAATRAKQMDAAEQFAREVEPDQLYPEDFVIYRITGYRPTIEAPAMLVGEALLAELANLVQRLSDGLNLPPDYHGRRALSMSEVEARLHVSSKTIQRYRRKGLICHFIAFPSEGEPEQRLACFEDALERFASGHQSQLAHAASFTRLDEEVAESIIAEARAMRDHRRISLNEAALALARKHNRAHETVRMLLRRHDRQSDSPIFTERGPLTERDGRVLHRAWRWGVPIALIAERYGRTATTIYRSINRQRADLLRELDLRHVELPTFEREDAAEVILGVPAVRTGLDELLPRGDALALLHAARTAKPEAEAEVALVAAYNFLKRRASRAIESLRTWPGATPLDEIETDLRWASRLKRRLLSIGIPAAIARIEQHLERSLSQQPSERIIEAIELAGRVSSEVIETLDPSRGQHLPRLVAYSTDRTLARGAMPHAPGRAAARHSAGAIAITDPFADIAPWDRVLDPPARLVELLPRLDGQLRRICEERWGLASGPPHTLSQLAEARGTSRSAVVHAIAQAETELRRFARNAIQVKS